MFATSLNAAPAANAAKHKDVSTEGLSILNTVTAALQEGKTVTVMAGGQKRRVFIDSNKNLCFFARRSSRRGYTLHEPIERIVSIIDPQAKKSAERDQLSAKYTRLAKKATFTNSWIKDCLKADPTKPPHQNSLTSGNRIDGKVITVSRLKKHMRPYDYERMLECIGSMNENPRFKSSKFDMDGYDCHVQFYGNTETQCSLSVEYKGCTNGYYYLLINNDSFIGYDID